jgi:PAS domain S-box-containing protein
MNTVVSARFPPVIPAEFESLEALAPLSELANASRQRDALYRLSEQLHRAGSIEEIYSAALTAIEVALGCDRSSILLFDEHGVMRFVAWHGLSGAYRESVTGHSPWTAQDTNAVPITVGDVSLAEFEPSLKAPILGEGINAVAFIPLAAGGKVIGKFMAYFREPNLFTPDDLLVAMTIARQLSFAIVQVARRKQAEARVLEREAEIAAELAATRSLQALSVEIAHEADLEGLYEKLVDAAQIIMHSQFASMQQYYPNRGEVGELKLLAHRGFDARAASFWTWVRAESGCTCAMAYQSLKRVVVADVEQSAAILGPKDLAQFRALGIRAVQSTPLLSRDGQLVGMISTHWNEPYQPTERDLRVFDILARIAADVIVRKLHEEDLRRREERARALTQLLTDVPWQARHDGAFEELQPAWENYTGQTWEAHSGHGWLDAVHPDDRDPVRASWAAAVFDCRPYEARARLWHAASNGYRRCLLRATPIRNVDGSLREWVGACTDVQEQPEH